MVLLLVIIYLAFISLGLPDALFGVSWPVVHEEFGLDVGFASVVTVIVVVGTVWTSFFAGRIIRRFGTGRVTAVSVGLTALGLGGISFSTSIWMTIASSIPLGIGAGAVDP
ncbi:MAG: MFS transporter, partial [Candidatus Izemoplasmatales bacterium]